MKTAVLSAASVCVLSGVCHAQVFTDRAAFEAAAGATTIETFEDAPLVGTPGSGAVVSIDFDFFRVDTSPTAAKVVDQPLFGSENTTPGGAKYLYLDTDRGFVGSRTTFTLDEETTAFAFDYTGMGERDNEFTVEIDGQTFLVDSGSGVRDGFWGYIGGPVTTVVLETLTDSGYGVDQVAFGGDGPCRADIDGDGSLTIFDFLAFQNLFDAGDLAADFDGDGQLTIFDFLQFQNEFDAGCD
ncbi:MAG: GC-type dockerin domain-anchored protein [Phycisphaerales bacterium]|jgi:hypothetical protein